MCVYMCVCLHVCLCTCACVHMCMCVRESLSVEHASWRVCGGQGISSGVILLSLSETAYLLFGLLCCTLRTTLAHELLEYSSVSDSHFVVVILGLWIYAATLVAYVGSRDETQVTRVLLSKHIYTLSHLPG